MNTAIVGCGHIAAEHIEALATLPDIRVSALCDINEAVATRLAEKFNIDRTYTDIDKLLAESRPDVVHVLTPPQSHLALSEPILRAGCHLLDLQFDGRRLRPNFD